MEGTYFITATGTDAGKTFVAEGLARALRARGGAVRALKPVMSGYDAAARDRSDAGRLLAACGEPVTAKGVASISPWRFAAPLSPDRAAARAGPDLDFDGLLAWCRSQILRSEGAVIIEGVGGVMTPLDAHHTVREWIAALDMPVLLVSGTYLGAVSHALCALAALREIDMAPAAIVVNESLGGVGIEDTLASLGAHVGETLLLSLRRDDADGIVALAQRLLG